MDAKTARIRALNDQLRKNFSGGIAVITPGRCSPWARRRGTNRQDSHGL
jgi:hypothetical protein